MGPKKKSKEELEAEAKAKAEADEEAKRRAEEEAAEDLKNPPKFDGQSHYVLDADEIYTEIAKNFPVEAGKAVSKREREELGLKQNTLVYGEISFGSFAVVFEKIKRKYGRPFVGDSGESGFLQKPGGKFYDLGSGTGKPVVAAAILHNFDKCFGIEILEGLYSMSLDVAAAYASKGVARLTEQGRSFVTELQMVRGDMLAINTESKDAIEEDWTDGDIVFANSTCYDDELMLKISNTAVGMRKGTFFISFTKRLPAPDFKVLEAELHPQSWGAATIYIMQKTTDPREINDTDGQEEKAEK